MSRAQCIILVIFVAVLFVLLFPNSTAVQALPTLYFVTFGASNASAATNDLIRAATKGNLIVKKATSVTSAVSAASKGDGLLVTADGMLPANPNKPQTDTTVNITESEWNNIRQLGKVCSDDDNNASLYTCYL